MIFNHKPLCNHFNVAVQTMAARLFPTGFDTSLDAPSTLADLTDHIAKTGRMLVYSGHSDQTIFDCEATNHAFRAWHDWCHWKFQLPFNAEGEAAACKVQQGHLATVYGADHWMLPKWNRILDAEINGQLEYAAKHGDFPTNQAAFVAKAIR
jgi:hypothetical protein